MAKIYTVFKGTYKEFTGNLSQLAEHFGINKDTLAKRLRNGMIIEEAIEIPVRKYYSQRKIYTYKGFTGNVSQLAKYFRINGKTLNSRLRNGMSIQEAIETPVKDKEKIYTYNGFTGNIA